MLEQDVPDEYEVQVGPVRGNKNHQPLFAQGRQLQHTSTSTHAYTRTHARTHTHTHTNKKIPSHFSTGGTTLDG